ncbi:MAG: aminomethyl-transferring glycine dehydrogenase subunit GcvPA [Coriobacteriia bacterium]|nr:aminomethyl-transferring glycine dehydrogenase subunit GcvPA [Coriobacteriia bacterium]
MSCEQREAMLRAVSASEVDDLFESIPAGVRLGRPLAIADGLTEMEAAARLRALADANTPAGRLVSFAGAGCYDHYIPAVVDHVLRKPEFFTAYTPYQPEVSQGTLQNIYEFQSMICELTGLEVANASMYDGATAFVEGALMAARVTKRHRIVVAGTVNPEWRVVLQTYADAGTLTVDTAPVADGLTTVASVAAMLDDTTAAVLVTTPNFLGHLEDLAALAEAAHAAGALLVVGTNPILAGVLEPPAAFGADIVVGEGQVLGNAMSLGGPGLGFFSCRMEHLRQMPGRVVGRTVDVDGNMAFVLTMQTREQHIRREKATSNICSNHALNALAAAVYLSAVGVAGLEGVGLACVAKAHYLRDALVATGKFSAPYTASFANEFALLYDGDVEAMHATMLQRGYIAGVDLGLVDPGMDRLVLFAVTEKRTRAEMDAFVREVASL